ncbi:hypothetical protein E2C01_069306 [Portunus trituberculatus]|uniref:Uncharacterized protein n=1 Tax=Portunus trituberculatus TaxID=210409 RepID=A0A5B7HZ04_PORTR|nr:hypothetical protein [Portunus trituberculatus]
MDCEKTCVTCPSLVEEGEGRRLSEGRTTPPLTFPHCTGEGSVHHQSLPAGNKVGMEIYFYCTAMVAVVKMASEAVVALCGNRPGWRRQRDKVAVVVAAR